MTFNLKLFKFISQDPILVFSNSKCLYKVESLRQSSCYFTLKMAHILTTQDYESLLNEANIHAMSTHSKIISFKGYSTSESIDEFGLLTRKFFFLLEFHHQNLNLEIKSRKKKGIGFTLDEIMMILIDLVEVLSFLQGKNICFRNVTVENVFWFDNRVKLGNFDRALNNVGGSDGFLTESHENIQNLYKSDVFSLGILLLEVIFMVKLAKNNILEINNRENIDRIKALYGKEEAFHLVSYLEIMLEKNPEKRPNFLELESLILKSDINKKPLLPEEKTALSPPKPQLFFIKEPNLQPKLEKSVYLFEESKASGSDSLNERDSDTGEEMKEASEKKQQKLVINAKESCFSTNFFGLDRDSNLQISEIPGLKHYTPEKLLIFQRIKLNLIGLNLKLVELESLKISKAERPKGMELQGDVFFCNNRSHLSLVVKVIKELNEENLLAILNRYKYINSKDSINLLKLEEYALEIILPSFFNLYLVFKQKKWDLKSAIQNKNFPVIEKLSIARQILKVLITFNEDQREKIVHGNLKPSNIMLDNKNCVFITDFGTSETFIEGENLKRSRRIAINYSPPEQFLYQRLEINSDIWSLGIIFYELFFNILLSGENMVKLGLYDENKRSGLLIEESLIGQVLWKQKVAGLVQRMTLFDGYKRSSLQEISLEINSIENMLRYPSSLNEYKINEENHQNMIPGGKNSKNTNIAFLTKQVSHNYLKKEEKSEGKRFYNTPKVFSKKTKLTK